MADNLEEICCPACGKKMQKVYMEAQDLYLDVCLNGCGGIYFDNREFKKFDERHEDITPLLEAYKGKTFQKVDSFDKRICPVCNMEMVKHYSSSKQEVQVDDCYSCGGVFLDYCELERIRSEYVNEQHRSADAMAQFEYTLGSDLRDRAVMHSNLKDRYFLMKHFGGFVKKLVMKFDDGLQKEL